MLRPTTGSPPRVKVPRGSIDTQMHVYLPGFLSEPGCIPLPPNAPGVEDYRQVMQWLGIDRVIITQGNAHGRNNSNLVASLAAMGGCARGVGIVDGSTIDAEMERLSMAGFIGARVMDLPGGAVHLDELPAVDARTAAHDWYIAVQFNGSDILAHEPELRAIRSRWVLDHHGKFLRGAKPDGPEIAAVKRLIDAGNCWFKLAGCYESSLSGPPGFVDVAAITREIAAYAPERLVWGTNWPHNRVTSIADYPDDAKLFDDVLGWLPDDFARRRTLVDNPAELANWPAT